MLNLIKKSWTVSRKEATKSELSAHLSVLARSSPIKLFSECYYAISNILFLKFK